MTRLKRVGLLIAAWVAVGGAMELGASLNILELSGLVTPAEAIVGRPLTPVSVAGVARRTVRRCAVGVYYC